MSLTSKFHISWLNDLASYTIVPTTTAETNFPITNMQNVIQGEPARFDITALTELDFTWSSSTERTANMFIIQGHNLLSDATVKLTLYTDVNQTGVATVVINDDPIYLVIPWGEMISGIFPWGNFFSDTQNLRPIFAVGFDTQRYKSAKLELTVPSAVNDIVEIDKMRLDFGFTPLRNFSYGARTEIDDNSKHFDQDTGGQLTTNKAAVRKLTYDFRDMKDTTDGAIMMHIFQLAKLGGDLGIISNPNDTGISKMLSSGIFKRQENAAFEQIFFDGSDLGVILKEN